MLWFLIIPISEICFSELIFTVDRLSVNWFSVNWFSQPMSARATSKAFNFSLWLLHFQVGLQNSCYNVRGISPFTGDRTMLRSLHHLSCSQGCSTEGTRKLLEEAETQENHRFKWWQIGISVITIMLQTFSREYPHALQQHASPFQ